MLTVTLDPAVNAVSNWYADPLFTSVPSTTSTLPKDESTMGESTREPPSAALTEPRHGGLPEAHAPTALPTSLTKLSCPPESPTKMFREIASKTGPVRTNPVWTVTGQPPVRTS